MDPFENVLMIGERPVGVIVMVPVYGLFGVMVKLVEEVLMLPDVGPVRV